MSLIRNSSYTRPSPGFKATPKRFGVGIIVAVTAPAHALQGSVAGQQGLKGGGGVLAALVRMNHEPGGGLAHGQGPAQRPGLERLAVFAPFIRRGLALFCGHDSGNIRPASVRLE